MSGLLSSRGQRNVGSIVGGRAPIGGVGGVGGRGHHGEGGGNSRVVASERQSSISIEIRLDWINRELNINRTQDIGRGFIRVRRAIWLTTRAKSLEPETANSPGGWDLSLPEFDSGMSTTCDVPGGRLSPLPNEIRINKLQVYNQIALPNLSKENTPCGLKKSPTSASTNISRPHPQLFSPPPPGGRPRPGEALAGVSTLDRWS